MAYDKKFIVPIPEGTISVKNRDKTYIYHVVEKRYKKDKKYNSDIRVPVGIRVENTNTMYINDNFIKYYRDAYEEKNVNEKISDKLCFSDAINYGATAVLHKLANQIKLLPIIRNNFDFEQDVKSNSIINLATKFILTNNSSIVSYPHFARNNLILGNKNESDTEIEQMLSNISEADIDSFLEDWVYLTCNDKDLLLSIDGPNVQTEANDIEIAELGYSKNKIVENQFSFTLVTEQVKFTPVYYKEYDGIIHDLPAAKKVIEVLKKGKPKSINFVLDRGYFSSELMKNIIKVVTGFIMMAKENKQIRENIDFVIDDVYSVENYIPSLDLYGFRTVFKPFKNINKTLFYHVYYSSDVKNENTKALHKIVIKMKEELVKLIGIDVGGIDKNKYEKYFKLTFENDKLIKIEIDKEKIDEILKYSGYFVIVTSYISSPEKAYQIYHNRDYTEKLIMMMKTFEQFDCVRCHDTSHLRGKNLCMFIGLILRNEIFIRTKDLRENTKDKKAYTTPEILRELNCIQATKDSDGKYSKKTAYTKKEKAILEALDIQISNIESALKEFNKNLV